MAFLYLTEQGAVLKKTGERLLVVLEDQTVLDIPASKVEGVLIFGNVQFTTQVLQLLLAQGVEFALFSRRGKLLGQLTAPFPKNIELRQAQYQRAADPAWSRDFARLLVAGKLANALALVREFAHNHPEVDLAAAISDLAASLEAVNQTEAPTLNKLLGLEGLGSRRYFQCLAQMVRHSFGFTGRQRHPAPDPVNALLSLGYTLVYNELSWLLDGLGFDPYLGFYHQPRFGHATLASDLLEEFRAPLVDRLTLYLVNERLFQAEDFYLHTSGGMYLRDEPRKRYFREYERFLNRPLGRAAGGEAWSYRRLFRRQVERLRQAVLTGSPYEPYSFSW